MKKTILIALGILCLIPFLPAQTITGLPDSKLDTIPKDIIDHAKYRAYYHLAFVQDTKNPDLKTESQTLLQIGSKYSSFKDLSNLRKDSISDALSVSGASANEILGTLMPMMRLIKFKPTIIKQYPEHGDMLVQEMVTPREVYRYEDKQVAFDWKLVEESKNLEGYTAKKATTTFRGRAYTAWYTEEIPISEGPYLFYGLPGLILELYDDQDHYHFTINGFESVKSKDKMYITTKNVINSSRENVHKTIENLRKNPQAILNALGAQVKNVDEIKSKIKPKPHNPIELK